MECRDPVTRFEDQWKKLGVFFAFMRRVTMSISKSKLGIALLNVPAILLIAGCACKASTCRTVAMTTHEPPVATAAVVAQLLPSDAKPGECYAKVFVPEQFESRTESVCTREASERLEIVPAKY